MSKYVWVAAAALVLVTAAVLFWADRSDAPAPSAPPPPTPLERVRADGGAWRPHLDRAGLRRMQTK